MAYAIVSRGITKNGGNSFFLFNFFKLNMTFCLFYRGIIKIIKII